MPLICDQLHCGVRVRETVIGEIRSEIRSRPSGWPIGMPVCRILGGGLWEVRSNIKNGIARVIFCLHKGKLVLLNGFVKKTQKTPQFEIELARKRKMEIER